MIGQLAPAFIGVLATSAITIAANILLRFGLQRSGGYSPGNIGEVLSGFLKLLLDPYFFVGFIAYFAAALVWFRTINLGPLSIIYPTLVGLTFLGIMTSGALIWCEPINVATSIGACFIIVGVLLVSFGAKGF